MVLNTKYFFKLKKNFPLIFEFANTETLLKNFVNTENECKSLIEKNSLPAYDQCLKEVIFLIYWTLAVSLALQKNWLYSKD